MKALGECIFRNLENNVYHVAAVGKFFIDSEAFKKIGSVYYFLVKHKLSVFQENIFSFDFLFKLYYEKELVGEVKMLILIYALCFPKTMFAWNLASPSDVCIFILANNEV